MPLTESHLHHLMFIFIYVRNNSHNCEWLTDCICILEGHTKVGSIFRKVLTLFVKVNCVLIYSNLWIF